MLPQLTEKQMQFYSQFDDKKGYWRELGGYIRSKLSCGESSFLSDDGIAYFEDIYSDDTGSGLFLYLFQPGVDSIRWGCARETFQQSLDVILENIMRHARFSALQWHQPTVSVVVEFLCNFRSVLPKQVTTAKFGSHRFEPGITGIRVSRPDGSSFYYLPTEAVVSSHMTFRQALNTLTKKTGFGGVSDRISERIEAMLADNSLTYDLFETVACLFQSEGSVTQLYRAQPFPADISGTAVLDAALEGAHWSIRNMKPNGQFLYYYEASDDNYRDHEHPGRPADNLYYNLLRHCGGIVTLLRAYRATKNPLFISRAELAIDFYLRQLRIHDTTYGKAAYGFYNKKSKLGGTGIGLVALMLYREITGNKVHDEICIQMTRHLLSRISEEADGEFLGYYIHPVFNNGEPLIDVDAATREALFSFYYPGEALFGLALVAHQADEMAPELKSELLRKSELALDWLVEKRPKLYPHLFQPLPSDGWLMQAIESWVDIEGFDKPSYINFVFNDAQAMTDYMYRAEDAPYLDYPGSFYYAYGDHAYPDGARAEGLIAAVYLAHKLGDTERFEYLMASSRLVAWSVYHLYNSPEAAFHHLYPQKSIGSFRFKLTRQWVRVDSVQHVACYYFRHWLMEESLEGRDTLNFSFGNTEERENSILMLQH